MDWGKRLRKLGFTAEQMVRCQTSSGGLVRVPARVNDDPVLLVLSNNHEPACLLYESYATDHALPVSVEGTRRFTQVETLSAFGLTATNVRSQVWGGAYRSNTVPVVAGFVNAPFFSGGIVAIDASVPVAAFAATRDQLSLDGAVCRLAIKNNQIALEGHHWHVGTYLTSFVTPTYLGDVKPGRNGRAHLSVTLPGGIAVAESVAVSPNNTRMAGMLGSDLWCRWVTVFDYTAGELLLFSYD